MSEIEPRATNAGEIVGAMVDTLRVYNVPVTGRAKGMIGRQAKELLVDGFEPDVILAASVLALRRGEPQNMHFIAQDIVLMQAGQLLSRKDYRDELGRAAAQLNPSRGEELAREAYERRRR